MDIDIIVFCLILEYTIRMAEQNEKLCICAVMAFFFTAILFESLDNNSFLQSRNS